MKKLILSVCTLVAALIAAAPAAAVLAEEDTMVAAKSSLLMHADTGTVILENNADARHPIASMCKIMTLLLTFEQIDKGELSMDQDIFVSEHAAGMGGSQAFLEQNDSYKLSDLVKCVTVASANDAAVAISETIAGSEEGFVARMNERAKELGMLNTNFANATGLPKPMQYSCARDVAMMTRELLKHKAYYEFSGIWMYTLVHKGGRETGLTNTNKLIRFYKGCDAGKTGYTNEAKHCISASAMRDGTRLIAVVIGADSSQERFQGASKMLNYGFANFETEQVLANRDLADKTVTVRGGRQDTAKLELAEEFSMFLKRGEKSDVNVELRIADSVSAPVRVGECVGKAVVTKDGRVLFETDILAAENVEANTWGDNIRDIIGQW